MDSQSVVAMCIDIQATICPVMRVKRDGSPIIDVSDEESVPWRCPPYTWCAVFSSGKALLLLQATTDFGMHQSLCWKDDLSCGFLEVRKVVS